MFLEILNKSFLSMILCSPNERTSFVLNLSHAPTYLLVTVVQNTQRVLRQVHSCQEILAQMLLSKIPSVETYPQREFVCENISVKIWFYYIAPLIQFLGKNASQTLSPI